MNRTGKKLGRWLRRDQASGQDDPLEKYLAAYHDSPQGPLNICLTDLEKSHCQFGSSLHRQAGERDIDIAAFIYSVLRLPDCFEKVDTVLLYTREENLSAAGISDLQTWARVSARARRRRAHFDGHRTLALFITSVSDLDDLLPALCAIQIEWNKMHDRLKNTGLGRDLASQRVKASDHGPAIRRTLGLSAMDWDLLQRAWPDFWDGKLAALAAHPKNMEVRRLPLDQKDFQHAAATWWEKTIEYFSGLELTEHPIYLVSGNTHSLANLICGYTGKNAARILEFVLDSNPDDFRRHWQQAQRESDLTRRNLLYYAQRLYLENQPELASQARNQEKEVGFERYTPQHYPHLEINVFPLAGIKTEYLDPFLDLPGDFRPPKTEAVLINLDYPLGFAAHHLLEQSLKRFAGLSGIYVLGKSAAMIGRLGDIMIPGQVHDLHSGKLYRFRNVFTARHLVPYLNQIAAFDDQKSITVRGAFLHGWETISQLHHLDFTGLEMEAGPYLSALEEHFQGTETDGKTEVKIDLPRGLDFGLLHYTSDTPYNVRASLLSRRLGLSGLEAAYGCSRAILRRILQRTGEVGL